MVIETNITKMFGIKHPILNAPMGPFLSNDIAIAVCEAGGLGVVSHSGGLEAMKAFMDSGDDISKVMQALSSRDYMKENLEYVVEHTDKPFGFNLRTSRNELDAIQLTKKLPKVIMANPKLKEQVVYAVTSAGSAAVLPKSKSFQKLREASNIKHFHVAPALWLADKCVSAGVDGLCVTGGEGGGHQSFEKVSTLVLLQQVREKYPDLPIVACGGFANGYGLAAALAMGAGAVVMGTRFIASKDSEYHENYKKIVPPAKAGDTRLVTGMLGPIRLWKNKYCLSKELVKSKEELVGIEQARSPQKMLEEMSHYISVLGGDIENSAVLLGQSAGVINSLESIDDIISSLVKDAEKLLKNSAANVK
jgi:enoyl-[acyl-carrier protein] reductase II